MSCHQFFISTRLASNGSSIGGEVTQGAQAWQKKICAALDRDELRQVAQMPRRAVASWSGKLVHDRTAGYLFAVTEKRIALVNHPGKLRVHDPGILQKLELPRDIGIQAEEMQSALRLIRQRRGEHLPLSTRAALILREGFRQQKAALTARLERQGLRFSESVEIAEVIRRKPPSVNPAAFSL